MEGENVHANAQRESKKRETMHVHVHEKGARSGEVYGSLPETLRDCI